MEDAMKTLKWFKRFFLGFIGLISVIPRWGLAEENKNEASPVADAKDEQQVKASFSKDNLIRSLRQMNRNPKEIKTISAMCYKMMLSPKEMQFQCDICGHTTIYATASDQGALVKNLPYIKRSLSQMPYKISIDSTGLCSICGKGKDKVLVMRVSCFNCGKEFSWEVKNQKDITMLQWLYLKPPIKEIDATDLELWDKTEEGIKEGAKYIHEHVFCPECQQKIKLEE